MFVIAIKAMNRHKTRASLSVVVLVGVAKTLCLSKTA